MSLAITSPILTNANANANAGTNFAAEEPACVCGHVQLWGGGGSGLLAVAASYV